MNDSRRYSICVRLRDEDGEQLYCATVKELPDVSVYEDTFGAAYEGAVSILDDLQASFAERSKAFPLPTADTDASGRTTLRMSKTLHRRVAAAAAADDISLNQWIVEAVAWRLTGMHASAIVNAPNAVSIVCHAAESGQIVVNSTAGQNTISRVLPDARIQYKELAAEDS